MVDKQGYFTMELIYYEAVSLPIQPNRELPKIFVV
jgi:hypothetical protein